MDQSDQIIGLLEEISRRLDRIESEIESIADISEELESRFAVICEDQAAIRADIDRLEPGVI